MSKKLKIRNSEGAKFKVVNKTVTTAEIIIYSEIGFSWWGDGIDAKSFSDELKEIPKSVTQIDVRINSPGGDVFDGITIYNRLKQHSANVTVYVDGLAASIASIIMMAGDEIILSEGAMIMVHKPMSGLFGNSIELEELISRLDDVEEQLVGIYKRKTGLDRSEIKSMLAKETWLGAEEAIELGFVDKIMEEDDEVQMAASFNKCPWMKGKDIKNTSNKSCVQKHLNELKQEAEALLTR